MSVQASVRATTADEVVVVGSGGLGDDGDDVAASCSSRREARLERGAAADDTRDDEAIIAPAEGDGVEHRFGVRAEDIEHRGAGGALGDGRLQLGQPRLAAGEDEVLLCGEVVEDRLLRHIGGDGDLGNGDGVEPALGEEPACGRSDRGTGGALLALSQTLGRSLHSNRIITVAVDL